MVFNFNLDLDFSLIKRGLTVIILFAVIGFIIYKMSWKNNNILTAGRSRIIDLQTPPMNINENQMMGYHQDEQTLNSIQEHISKQSELDVLQCYRDTSSLRMRLLNKQLRATDIIDSKHLLPKGIVIPKEDDYRYKQNTIDIERVAPEVSQIKQGSANINYPTMITNIPNYF